MKHALLPASRVEGLTVRDPDGKDLGTIHDFMMDVETGQILYAILTFGGFLGMGKEKYAIPYKAFHYQAGERALFLDISKETIENAPKAREEMLLLQPDRDYVHQLITHYGYEEYYLNRKIGE